MDLNKDYRLQRSLRKILSVPTSVRAIPTTDDVVQAHVSDKAAESAEATKQAMSRELRSRKLADIVRRSQARRDLGYESLREKVRSEDLARTLEGEKLAEGIRQKAALRELRYTELGYDRANREAMKSLGRKANLVEIMNIGATVAGGWHRAKEQERMFKELEEMYERHHKDLMKIYQ